MNSGLLFVCWLMRSSYFTFRCMKPWSIFSAAASPSISAELSVQTPKGWEMCISRSEESESVLLPPCARLCEEEEQQPVRATPLISTHKGHFNAISLVLKSEHHSLRCVHYHQFCRSAVTNQWSSSPICEKASTHYESHQKLTLHKQSRT